MAYKLHFMSPISLNPIQSRQSSNLQRTVATKFRASISNEKRLTLASHTSETPPHSELTYVLYPTLEYYQTVPNLPAHDHSAPISLAYLSCPATGLVGLAFNQISFLSAPQLHLILKESIEVNNLHASSWDAVRLFDLDVNLNYRYQGVCLCSI